MAENTQKQQLETGQRLPEQRQNLQELRDAAKLAQEKALAELGANLEQLARRLGGGGTKRPSEVYASIKEKLFGSLKNSMPDFATLSLQGIVSRLGDLPPAATEQFLGQNFAKFQAEIDTVTAEIAKENGMDSAALERARGMTIETKDHSADVSRFVQAASEVTSLAKLPGAIEGNLAEDNALTGVVNVLRSIIGMSEMDASPKEMLKFLTAFKQAELKERGAEFTPQNFQNYLAQNSGTFLGLFQQSKVGVQSFMEFMKNSPNSVATVFGEIGRETDALRRLDEGVRTLESLLPGLQNAPLRKELTDQLRASLAPLLASLGLKATGDVRADLLALRHTIEKIEDSIQTLSSFANMSLTEKAAYVRILQELSSGKFTYDMAMLALFVLQIGIGFGGGLIPNESGQWVGSKIFDAIKPMMPQLQITLTPDQITGAIGLGTALLGGVAIAGTTAHIVRSSAAAQGIYEPGSKEYKEQQALREKPFALGEDIGEKIEGEGNRLLDSAFLIADFGGLTQNAMRTYMQSSSSELPYLSEPKEKVQRFRGALTQMGTEMQASLSRFVPETATSPNIAETVGRFYDAKTAPMVVRALSSLDLQSLTGDALTTRITAMLKADINVSDALVAKAQEIASRVQEVKAYSAAAIAKQKLEAYLAKTLRLYNALEEVKKESGLRLSPADLLRKKPEASAPEKKENLSEQTTETPILSQIELQAQTALFNLEKKYFDVFKANPNWMTEKFGTQEHMRRVFGNAIMNSILRALFENQTANYVKPSAQFTGAQVSRWFLDLLPESQKQKQVELPPNFDVVFERAQKDPSFPKRVTAELNRLISQAAGKQGAAEDLLLRDETPMAAITLDSGMTPEERVKATDSARKNLEVTTAVQNETAILVPKLTQITDSLKGNSAFQMLSVLRAQVIGQKDSGSAMKFLAKKIQETMRSNGGVSSFVEAWNALTKNKESVSLLQSYDALRNKAMQAGVQDAELEKLEGEVSAMRVLTSLSAPELMDVLQGAATNQFWSGAGDIANLSWGAAKLAFAIIGADRVASWLKMPDWKLSLPDFSKWNVSMPALPAAQVDTQGLAMFGALTVSQYSMAAMMAMQSYAFEKRGSKADVDATRLGLKISEEVAKQYKMQEQGGVWRFEDEAANLSRIDALLAAQDVQSQSIVQALLTKYAIAPGSGNARAALRSHLISELDAQYAQRKIAVLASAAAMAEEVLKAEAKDRRLENPEPWIAAQRDRVQRMYLSVLSNQLQRK
ncbi:hypothetical protein COW46_00415 [Candidatus Gracilibacteria bacterium CG17_big_fil_post_rev_8_21_14_2_50_48_13]|nr:MAG: hypothetical protein COW46_00415 [Candidatus Gracilibacteria bacterium CG17_big_fil_post_rev_8_21_14_2_50_48_13]